MLRTTLAHNLVANRSPWTVARALRLVATLAEALGLLHAQGLCHGALRADSIVLGAGSNVFIGDLVQPRLDAARFLEDAAPEIRAGEAPTPRTDVFLLGTLLCRLLREPKGGLHRPTFQARCLRPRASMRLPSLE